MKFKNPNHVALILTSIVFIVLVGFVFLMAEFQVNEIVIGFLLLSTLLVYFIFRQIIEGFSIDHTLSIYNLINPSQKDTVDFRKRLKSEGLNQELQKDVRRWAAVKQTEIKDLKEQAQFKREFVGNLAHELKTPIFNMQGYLHTLIEGGLEDARINYDYLDRADKNLERLVTLVEDLDSISRLESGDQELKVEKIDIIKQIREVFSLFELRAKKRKISMTLNKKYDRPIFIQADRSKIQQVLSNLVANALQYGKTGGVCEIRIFDMSQNVLIEVSDDGIGVAPNHLPRLFERFYRVDKSRSRHEGGTGLGLAICKHIIESHGQTVSARSVVEKGTTFSFTLEKSK
ncbi:ATP-binding protein [Salibacteraceae bacterium]|jgi:two-component system, OmpR family, phosphate regulon sensor histidine kinase PhoR|nr:ATP-binding protein [Salibacteraceae bacterium]MDB4104980.1 ATP-binding protein [Salibacteraceae bacterium]MDB9710154.1 ATP-binding protein [Salibacteraceae bacterium]MDC1304541.1 ATP-binding protein [Salibacteraceae bacterium]HAQ71644.1 two-component sensor histidine kinase [Flavobacteriales bacterium]